MAAGQCRGVAENAPEGDGRRRERRRPSAEGERPENLFRHNLPGETDQQRWNEGSDSREAGERPLLPLGDTGGACGFRSLQPYPQQQRQVRACGGGCAGGRLQRVNTRRQGTLAQPEVGGDRAMN